jgi:hypothetical protein
MTLVQTFTDEHPVDTDLEFEHPGGEGVLVSFQPKHQCGIQKNKNSIPWQGCT